MTTFELAVLIAAVLAFGLSGAVLALFGVAEGRPCVPVAVVGRRSYRRAVGRVNEAEVVGDFMAARLGIMALCFWLRQQIHTGPARYRVEYARHLEYWELRQCQLSDSVTNRKWGRARKEPQV
jgi:hypothetical protein